LFIPSQGNQNSNFPEKVKKDSGLCK